MKEFKDFSENDAATEEAEHFPIEPHYHPIHRLPRLIYDFLASAKLAMLLLVSLLICSIAGVTVVRGQQAWSLIFSTLWFNAILVLLVINVACCFFGRIWHRKISITSFGMILFHISFVTILLGIVLNSLFYFRGNMRLTEGESLPNGSLSSYDVYENGPLFSISRMKGETSLIKMHRGYHVAKEDKRAAYEIEVGVPGNKKRNIIYITHNLTYNGFTFYTDREGYSILVNLADEKGVEVYGAHLPLQSLRQQDDYLYTTGTKQGPSPFAFPQSPLQPMMGLQLAFSPSKLNDRSGDVSYIIRPLNADRTGPADEVIAKGNVKVGESFNVLEHRLTPSEVRYWVAMNVRYEPGKPIVLASLWVGFAGMLITTIGRMMRSRKS